VLARDAAALRLYPPPPPPDWHSPLSGPVRIAGVLITAREVAADPGFLPRFLASRARWEEAIDADALLSDAVLRTRRAGDRFLPLGAPGERKLQDFLTDLKLPRAERARTVVLEAHARWGERAVVWVAGRRIDDRARVGPGTRRVLILSAEPAATS
ncbi:MAG: tRNA lysidine(34) synthetase TilS, partial [Candidatus Brocadiae bacterium]|nr:tRNA lysidine(34) synthetase TilS [Candidatus Brocadiia bacterium]